MNKNILVLKGRIDGGNDRQCYLSLRSGDAFCFLGLMCDEYKNQTGEGDWVQVSSEDVEDLFLFDIDGFAYPISLPQKVMDWYGIDEVGAKYAAHWNDKKRESFKKILGRLIQECRTILKKKEIKKKRGEETKTTKEEREQK